MTDNPMVLKKMNREDVLALIKEYAAGYTPEWNISYDNPDAGTALALIFADQFMGNIEYYNSMSERYHEAFIQMLSISENPPSPASSAVIVTLIEHAVPGIYLQAGTKFTADGEEGKIIFESRTPVYITESSIDTVFMVSRKGEYKFLLGRFIKPSIGREENERIERREQRDFILFDFDEDSYWGHKLLISHNYLFEGRKELIRLKVKGGEELFRGIETRKFGIYYGGSEGIGRIDGWKRDGEDIVFSIPEQNSRITMIMIQAAEPFEQSIRAEEILLSAEGLERKPDFVCSDVEDCKVEKFRPFGESISLYSQCYIGCDDVFSKKEAFITLMFDVDYGEYRIGGQRKKEDLRIIKKRNYSLEEEYISDVYADEVVFEYFTGNGWKRLGISDEYGEMFGKTIKGRIQIRFRCPKDWEAAAIEGYRDKCIRIRITKAQNCYLQPCIHHYPIIQNMTVSYSYEGNYIIPDKLETITGMIKNDITKMAQRGQQLLLFDHEISGVGNRLYLGFDKKLQGGPVGIWVQKQERRGYGMGKVSFWYYGCGVWKRLKVIDHTEQFSHSGTIYFNPPSDMERINLYGEKRYCICAEEEGAYTKQDIISDIRFNSVEVMNIETGEEEDYYIDVSKPDMEFFIDCHNLLKADVWVNETGEYSDSEMRAMKEKMPERIHTETDYQGEIINIYVRWNEVNDFDNTTDKRVYMLNRTENKIIFGNGIRNRIPKITDDVAFKVTAYRCGGREGNVLKGKINDTRSNILYVDNVYNPLSAYGGSKRESMEMMLKRGAGLISSHGRLITEKDYIREIMGFSDCIHQVRCIMENNDVKIVLLMKDYKEGTNSFYKVKRELKRYIERRCDLSILPEQIHITEPLFVELHTSIWLKTNKVRDTFKLTAKIKDELTKYLNPVIGHDGAGWPIGIFPGYSQIVMKINTLKKDAVVKKVLVTAKYTDASGVHECDLEKVKNNPMAVVISGEHQIFTE